MACRIEIEKTYLGYALTGRTIGIVVSSYTIVPHITASYAKMGFVSIGLSFGAALCIINHMSKRKTRTSDHAGLTFQGLHHNFRDPAGVVHCFRWSANLAPIASARGLQPVR